jgi:RNA polymerase sigma factor (sigma-70 family)
LNTTTQDETLLQGLINNNNECIAVIYKENYPMVHSLVVKNSGDDDEAKDIFQEAVVVLFEKAKQPGFVLTCKISTYLYAVARRLWLKKLQNNNYKKPIADHIEETVAVEDDVEFHENQNLQLEQMNEALLKIGEPCKSLLEAYYFNKQQMQAIAAQFGYTNAENAKNQKYKCLVRLKKIFFAQHKNL